MLPGALLSMFNVVRSNGHAPAVLFTDDNQGNESVGCVRDFVRISCETIANCYCTKRALSRPYSSAEIEPVDFNRSSFSISSATLKPNVFRKSSRRYLARA